MKHRISVVLLVLSLVIAHGDHTFDLDDESDHSMPYAERHMHTEHHIDSFDLESFFKLHDLDMDGQWDEAEIRAVYGLGHHSLGHGAGHAEGKDERTEMIVREVLRRLDRDHDGKISLAEYEAGGKDGLPSFSGYKDLGHHYDEESE